MRSNLHGSRKAVGSQLIASVCFAMAAAIAPVCGAPVPSSPSIGLLFEFSRPVRIDFWQTVVMSMEHADLSAFFEHPVVLMERKRAAEDTEFADLIQVTLRGDCASGLDLDSREDGALGWVYLLDGRIQRFVVVDCNQIAHMLRSELRDKAAGVRQRVMANAISYVIVHELVHIATQDPGHREAGLLKPRATKADLLAGGRDIPKPLLLSTPRVAPCATNEITEASPLEGGIW